LYDDRKIESILLKPIFSFDNNDDDDDEEERELKPKIGPAGLLYNTKDGWAESKEMSDAYNYLCENITGGPSQESERLYETALLSDVYDKFSRLKVRNRK
jgi:hypothetical protein